jgi:hypothetical protein
LRGERGGRTVIGAGGRPRGGRGWLARVGSTAPAPPGAGFLAGLALARGRGAAGGAPPSAMVWIFRRVMMSITGRVSEVHPPATGGPKDQPAGQNPPKFPDRDPPEFPDSTASGARRARRALGALGMGWQPAANLVALRRAGPRRSRSGARRRQPAAIQSGCVARCAARGGPAPRVRVWRPKGATRLGGARRVMAGRCQADRAAPDRAADFAVGPAGASARGEPGWVRDAMRGARMARSSRSRLTP